MYVQNPMRCSPKAPGCVPTGVNAHAAYTQATFVEVSTFLCVICTWILSCVQKITIYQLCDIHPCLFYFQVVHPRKGSKEE